MQGASSDGSSLDYAYDPSGRVTSIQAYEPDGAGGTQPMPSATDRFGYDACGLLASAHNGAAQVWFERDAAGRVVAESQNHRRIASTYDACGRRTRRATGFAAGWDAGGQAPVGFQGFRPEDIAAGQIVASHVARPPPAAVPDGTTGYGYDPLGLLSELSLGMDPSGAAAETVRFTRDSGGREVGRGNGLGFALEQSRDVLGRLVRQVVTGRAVAARPAAFGSAARAGQDRGGHTRSYASDRTSAPISVADDLWGGTSYAYDANGQVTEARHGDMDAGCLAARLRPSSPGGSLGLGDDAVEVERFSYDAAKDLTASDTALPGDPLGRVLTPWLLSAGGLVSAARGPGGERVVLTHDANGRVVARRVERAGFRSRLWSYRWDAFDRLVGCTAPDGEVWQYGYDPFGRRVEKRRLRVAAGKSCQAGTCFTWDGDVVAEAVPIAADGALAVDRRVTWHFAPGSFVPLAREGADGAVHHVVTDHLGTPRELVSPQGGLAWAAASRC